ncbi:outer membrane protein [Kordiimonas pumila]|uniref:Outer membrane protein n=1 Tax=Kordiimonas pumila TaxID=2161677 RepID=A0ABV7D417_9PROT|nr:outer membrane beta-barrel protein [Kordiimonas pumila]
MSITKTIIAASIVSLTAATATLAQDGKYFDGSYVGIEGGLDWTELAIDSNSDNSLYYGGVIGFRNQMDSGIVTGIEGSFGDTGYKNDLTGTHSNYEWSASLILGKAFGQDGTNLLYGKAGYVRTNFDATPADDDSYGEGGWRFGGGYERAVNERLSMRLGADYTTYGNDENAWQTKAGVLVSF